VGAGAFYFGCRNVSREAARELPVAAAPVSLPAPARHPAPGRSADPPARADHPAAAPLPAAGEAPASGARVALVVDDLGRSVEEVETLFRLGVPVTYAVLPFESETGSVVAALARHGAQVLCHLPMQPVHGQNPGPGALLYGMSEAELRDATTAALAAVPGAVGVNNHMGSRLSADERSMRAVLAVLKERGLFFLDSRTSPESVGYRLASRLGVPAAERQVFLDSDPRPEIIREQFLRTLELARKRGAAIAIGHPHPATLAMLAAEVPEARAQGYEFVTVSRLLDRPEGRAAR
jgi:uncharacterized protein